jgi:hypothetical protein
MLISSNYVNTIALPAAASALSASMRAPAAASALSASIRAPAAATPGAATLPAAAAAADPARVLAPTAAAWEAVALPAEEAQADSAPTLAPTPAAPGVGSQAVPAFITPASLLTISGGTASVTLLWQVAKTLVGKPADSPWLAFLFSLLIGVAIYLLSIQDAKVQATLREKIVGGFIGFLNSMVLFAAAVGIVGRQ